MLTDEHSPGPFRLALFLVNSDLHRGGRFLKIKTPLCKRHLFLDYKDNLHSPFFRHISATLVLFLFCSISVFRHRFTSLRGVIYLWLLRTPQKKHLYRNRYKPNITAFFPTLFLFAIVCAGSLELCQTMNYSPRLSNVQVDLVWILLRNVFSGELPTNIITLIL